MVKRQSVAQAAGLIQADDAIDTEAVNQAGELGIVQHGRAVQPKRPAEGLLRFSTESGLEKDHQYSLYRNGMFPAIAEADHPVELDMRMGGGRTSYREAARELGVPYRISFKFNGEFMGLPYHPADVLCVGYSFGDDFAYPREARRYNEVWALGSHRVLVWGSESFGRQFGVGATLGGRSVSRSICRWVRRATRMRRARRGGF